MSLHQHTLTELKALLDGGDISSRELTDYFLARIERFDGELNSFVTVTAEQARSEADAADVLRSKGTAGLLNGLPIAHKDIFCTSGVRTSCGSRMLDNFISPTTPPWWKNARCRRRHARQNQYGRVRHGLVE